jgi:DNA invertase Pin-like site-specific DNA recombinase
MRAAQYVRMSTERQEYSIANQKVAIQAYADEHDFQIVKTYEDSGRSGINLAKRPGLQNLLADVIKPEPGFRAILVYDVTRWGRFQDIDESAYYDFLCKKAGINIHYCAELFSNAEPNQMTALLKAMKRVMAGEYLRELSAKVFAGQCRLVRMGYKMGSSAGYGLRRLLVAQDGTPKQILRDGEQKALCSEHVRYTLGPPHEVETVKQIFSWYLDDGYSTPEIADRLTGMGIPRHIDRPWNDWAVYGILSNPKYAGFVVFNRTSRKLGAKNKVNPIEDWVIASTGQEPIIAPERFLEVAMRRRRIGVRTNAELLADLRKVLQVHGKITARAIDSTIGVPCYDSFVQRFGSLAKAYEDLGYQPKRGYFSNSLLRYKTPKLRKSAIASIARLIRVHGLKVEVGQYDFWVRGLGGFGLQLAHRTFHRGKPVWDVSMPSDMPRKRVIVGRISLDYDSASEFILLAEPLRNKCGFRLTEERVRNAIRGTASDLADAIAGMRRH